ncbi:MAGE family-domain-containing protein [Phyllosticta capitalensis]|uniref:MAGE family-domain-containing protein n=1 Tax=Phyllosticta capitalensis TaxID=121624 RepID=UPI0031308724
MPLVRRRARDVTADDSETETPRTQRRRVSPSSDVEDDGDADADPTQGETSQLNQMAFKLVRLAFSNEHSRIPTRRTDISAKVLGSQGRQFKNVFNEAQQMLRSKFAVELTPLPSKEKITMRDRRAAAKSDKTNNQITAWVLTSTLSQKYRKHEIIGPSKAPTFEHEASYTGLYSFIIACIVLNGGSIPESKLQRYLQRMNAEKSTPVGKSDDVVKAMQKHLYITKTTEMTPGGDEMVEYTVGPRGKVEVGEQGVSGLVRTVYGEDAPDDLERKLERSLRLAQSRVRSQPQPQEEATQNGIGRGRGRPRRQEQDGEPEDD